MKNLVVIPTFNERENIALLIKEILLFPNFDVMVVDDGSPDGTGQIVVEYTKKYPERVHLIRRPGKLGLGTAYIAGFRFGLENDYDLIYEMDADFSHNPKDLLRLQEACEKGADVAVGSRYTPGGGFQNWPKNRIFISRGASLYVRLVMGMPVTDPTAGFVCYRSKVLRAINLDKIEFVGYGFQIEMKYVAWKLGFKIVEVPIIFKDRELGKSKMHIGIIREAALGVVKLKLRRIVQYYGMVNT